MTLTICHSKSWSYILKLGIFYLLLLFLNLSCCSLWSMILSRLITRTYQTCFLVSQPHYEKLSRKPMGYVYVAIAHGYKFWSPWIYMCVCVCSTWQLFQRVWELDVSCAGSFPRYSYLSLVKVRGRDGLGYRTDKS